LPIIQLTAYSFRMKHKLLLLLGLIVPAAAFPLESVYIGGQVGQVFLSNNVGGYNNAIGFAADLGFRTNPMLMVALRSQLSSHPGAGGITLWANTLSADVLIGNIYDIEFFLGGGPGFYNFSGVGRSAKFGLHGEFFGDLMVNDTLRLGLGFRYHGVFSPAIDEGNFWTIMARAGFSFGM
jgi:hypothetical protein